MEQRKRDRALSYILAGAMGRWGAGGGCRCWGWVSVPVSVGVGEREAGYLSGCWVCTGWIVCLMGGGCVMGRWIVLAHYLFSTRHSCVLGAYSLMKHVLTGCLPRHRHIGTADVDGFVDPTSLVSSFLRACPSAEDTSIQSICWYGPSTIMA